MAILYSIYRLYCIYITLLNASLTCTKDGHTLQDRKYLTRSIDTYIYIMALIHSIHYIPIALRRQLRVYCVSWYKVLRIGYKLYSLVQL